MRTARRLLAGATAVAVIATAGLLILFAQVDRAGLAATVFRSDGSATEALHAKNDRLLSWRSADALLARASGQPARIHWDGYLVVIESREYQFRIGADAPARLWVDGRLVFDNHGDPAAAAGRVQLTDGEHRLGIELGPAVRSRQFDVQWDGVYPSRLAALELDVLAPRSLSAREWRGRGQAELTAVWLCALWSAIIIAVLSLPFWKLLAREIEWTTATRFVLVTLAVLFVTGIWRGGLAGSPAEEIAPAAVLEGWQQRFGGGWHSKYPPLQYYLLALVYAPLIAADRLEWLSIHSAFTQLQLLLTGRMLTIAMAMGTILGIAILAARTIDRRHAWPAALCAGLFLPFPFYAKTMNLDVPYVFWFVWSLVFLVDLQREGRWGDVVAFGITASAAIVTKDQAYGLYVLPVLFLLWRFGRTRDGWKLLGIGAVAAALTVAAVSVSMDVRLSGNEAVGQWRLLATTARRLFGSLGVAGLLLVAAGARSPHYARARPAFLLVLLSVLSYYVTFIAVVGSLVDRSLLPVTTVMALCAAIGLRRLLDHGGPIRALGWILLLWLVARAASVEVLRHLPEAPFSHAVKHSSSRPAGIRACNPPS